MAIVAGAAGATKILEATILITDLLITATKAANHFTTLVEQARAEGRDLTDEELNSLRAASQASVNSLLEATKGLN